jgi:hypothetical protein
MNAAKTHAEHIDPAQAAVGWGGVVGSRPSYIIGQTLGTDNDLELDDDFPGDTEACSMTRNRV